MFIDHTILLVKIIQGLLGQSVVKSIANAVTAVIILIFL